MVSIEPLNCKMSYLFIYCCGELFLPLFLLGVKLLHALEDSVILFNNPRCVFQGCRAFTPLQLSVLKLTSENCVSIAEDKESHNVERKADQSQSFTEPYFCALNNRIGVSLNFAVTEGVGLNSKSISALITNLSLCKLICCYCSKFLYI